VRYSVVFLVVLAALAASAWVAGRTGRGSPAPVSVGQTANGTQREHAPSEPLDEGRRQLRADEPRRDLRADERLGGHTLERHVGKTDAELAARLQRERQISAASTYTDADTAERIVGATLAQSRSRIDAWQRRPGVRPNLVLNYAQATGPPIGRSLQRGARAGVPSQQALVVLRWDERADRWIVLTSYPEARR
jgi:hypothetical protein